MATKFQKKVDVDTPPTTSRTKNLETQPPHIEEAKAVKKGKPEPRKTLHISLSESEFFAFSNEAVKKHGAVKGAKLKYFLDLWKAGQAR